MVLIAEGQVPEDVEPCVELWVAALRDRDGKVDVEPVSARTRGVFAGPVVRFAVARAADGGSAPEGFAVTVPHAEEPPVAVLERIAVAPGAGGRGIGRALLMDALDASRSAGFDAVELGVRVGNPAVRLYEAAGFRAVGSPEPHPLGGAPMVRYRRDLRDLDDARGRRAD